MTAFHDSPYKVALWNLACRLAGLAHLLLGQSVVLPLLPAHGLERRAQ